MKTLTLIGLLALGLSGAVRGQGTIAFNNFTATPARVYVVTNAGAWVLAPVGFHVELMYAPIGGTNFSSARILLSGTGNGQFFDGSTVILSGIPAGTGNGDTNNVQLFIRGWTGAYSDFASASAAESIGNSQTGQTAVFLNPTGGAGTALPANMTGWLATIPLVLGIPEPSTVSLLGLGVGAFCLFRLKRISAAP